MMRALAVLVCVALVVVAPLILGHAGTPSPSRDQGRALVILTPHNEQIRAEFGPAFERWHLDRYGEPVQVIYNVPGGTSEIRRMLFAQFEAALLAGKAPGGGADLLFGGGSYEHEQLKQGVSVQVDGKVVGCAVSAPVDFSREWLESVYGANRIGDTPLYDEDLHWFGTALSGFGIVYNTEVFARLGLEPPRGWADLARSELRGWLGLVNPGQSGSVTTAFEAILQRLGWEQGWLVLRRLSANARYFSASALKPPIDVSRGEAAAGVCIDFFGRYQAQSIRVAGGGERVGYVDPPGQTVIDPDPISMLANGPNPDLARRFIEFSLSDAGQALWQFRASDGGGTGPRAMAQGEMAQGEMAQGEMAQAQMGPRRFELRRMPIRRSMYREHSDRFVDQVRPFEIAQPAAHPDPSFRSFIAPLFSAMAMETHEELREAWEAIVTHPAYPAGVALVRAQDVDDPDLRRMLEQFDAMPQMPTPDGSRLGLKTPEYLGDIKAGWLRGGWADAGLWCPHDRPEQALRRLAADFFRESYRQVVRGQTRVSEE